MNILLGISASGIVGTLMFVILLLLRPISKRLFSKTWHYYSFFVPLFFLLGGTLIAQNLAIESRHLTPEFNVQINATQAPFQMPYFARTTTPIIEGLVAQNASEATSNAIHIGELSRYILMIWVFGVALFAGVNIKRYLQYRNLLLSNAKLFKADCPLPVFISLIAHTPLLLGLIKPVIVLPNMHFTDAELNVILAHELVHYRRKDLFLKAFGLIANAIHWYNPVVYMLNKQLSIFCELSCDEKVISNMDTSSKKFYGETILQVLQHGTVQHSNILLDTNLCNSQKNIKRRLKSMMSTKKTKKYMLVISFAVAVFIIGGGFVISNLVDSAMPVYAADVVATGEPTRNIYYQGVKMGVETTEYAETVYIEARPLIFNGNYEMLRDIQEEMGSILFPTYVPKGFVLSSIGISNIQDNSPWPELFTDGCYKHFNNLMVTFSNDYKEIWLNVSHFQPYTRYENGFRPWTEEDLPYLIDNERHTSINGIRAAIGSPTEWHGLTVTLWDVDNDLSHLFSAEANSSASYSGTSYRFLADMDSSVSEDDLIRMAESLTNISALLQ